LVQPELRGSSPPLSEMPFHVVWGGQREKGGRGADTSWVGAKLVFNTQAKISGAISIAFSELLSSQNKGEFDPLVLLQQQDRGKKSFVRTHTHVYTRIYVSISICMVAGRL